MVSRCQRIMVQIGNYEWTQEVIYQACILARKNQGEIALVRMVRVQYISWLGTEFGNLNNTKHDFITMKDYQTIAEDFGIAASTYFYQYFTLVDAIIEAAQYTDADIIFAKLPTSFIPYWTQFQTNRLRHRLLKQQRVLVDSNSLLRVDEIKHIHSSSDLHADFSAKSQNQ